MDYVLGFDGGGTKTELLAVDLQGKELYSAQGGPSNPKAVTETQMLEHLVSLLSEAIHSNALKGHHCRAVALGLAGMATNQEQQQADTLIRHSFHKLLPDMSSFYITHDAQIALMAGLGRQHGIIAIAGTGAIVYGLTPTGNQKRAGGWGHILGDKGSGYEIGLMTLQQVMLAYDNVAAPTLLTERVLQHYGLNEPPDLRQLMYQPHIQKKHIAEAASVCIYAAIEGDTVATDIITRAAHDLASLTAALRHQDDWLATSEVAVTGSIFNYSELFLNTYRDELKIAGHRGAVILSSHKPAYGAALLALEQLTTEQQ